MSLIIPPGFLHAVYRLKLEGDTEEMVVTCGHEIDTASGANNDDAADDLFGAFSSTFVDDIMPNVYELTGVDVYIGNDGPTLVYTSTEAPFPGNDPAACIPPNTAYLIRKRTDLAGRRGRGRFYLPGVTEERVDNVGNVLSGTVGSMQTICDAFYSRLTFDAGARFYPPVVLHRSEGIGTEPPPTPITRFVVDGKVATQRRRLRP